jgi:hypothetical protein
LILGARAPLDFVSLRGCGNLGSLQLGEALLLAKLRLVLAFLLAP